jgi:hypothetical protein
MLTSASVWLSACLSVHQIWESGADCQEDGVSQVVLEENSSERTVVRELTRWHLLVDLAICAVLALTVSQCGQEAMHG